MPQIHSPYSSQLDLTVAALPTINIAKGCASGQEGPLTMTLVFNDENKRAHTLPRSGTHTLSLILSVLRLHITQAHWGPVKNNSICGGLKCTADTEVYHWTQLEGRESFWTKIMSNVLFMVDFLCAYLGARGRMMSPCQTWKYRWCCCYGKGKHMWCMCNCIWLIDFDMDRHTKSPPD